MFFSAKSNQNVVAVLFLVAASTPVARAQSAQDKFYRGYYLEQAQHDPQAAAKLYTQVVGDGRAESRLRDRAKARLSGCQEDVACADFARLMPPNALAFVEFSRPGERLIKLVKKLGLLADPRNAPQQAGKRLAISPALIEELLGIRGVAVAITGFDPKSQEPTGVAVFHPGNVDVIRGLLETGLPIGGEAVDPIGGFPTYEIDGKAFVTLTSRLVVVSTQPRLIKGVVGRLAGKIKKSLADSTELAETLRGRKDALLFFCVNAKPIMPIINGMIATAGMKNPELAMAQAVLDLNSLESLAGRVDVADDAIALEISLRLAEGHRNLVYNFLRTPAINPETLQAIPAGVAGFVVGALNEAGSRYNASAGSEGGGAPVVSALDFGREIFANITSFALFALAPEDGSDRGASPAPDAGAVITVNDPAKSEALWQQILGLASFASKSGPVEGAATDVEGVAVRRYRFPNNVTISFATSGNDVLIASSDAAMARTIRAKRGGESIVDDAMFSAALSRVGGDTTKALVVHPGRCAAIARRFMPPNEAARIEPFLDMLSDTVVSAVIDHSQGLFRINATVTGIPDVGDLVAMKLQEEHEQRVARNQVRDAIDSKNWDRALQAIDAQLAETPSNVSLLRKKFEVLAVGKNDAIGALQCGEQLLDRAGKQANTLNTFAWALLTEDQYGGRFNEQALKCSERSNKITHQSNWMFVDTLALARFETGDAEGAVELEKKAIELSGGKSATALNAALARFEGGVDQTKLAGKND